MLQRRILKAIQRKIEGDFPILIIFFFEAECGVSLCGVGNCRIIIRNCCYKKFAYSTSFNILKTCSLNRLKILMLLLASRNCHDKVRENVALQ